MLALLGLELHRFLQFAGANQFGLALDDAEQRAHHVHQVFRELARLEGRGNHGGLRGFCLRTLVHVEIPVGLKRCG